MPSTKYTPHSYRKRKGEPHFTLLGRDPSAVDAILSWIAHAEMYKTHSRSKIAQARRDMRSFRKYLKKNSN